MFTYIKHNVSGFYIELEKELDNSLYSNIGTTWQDFINDMYVLLSDEQVAFREEHPTASVSEVWNMSLKPVHERTLQEAKNEMVSKIENYDRSDSVNTFIVNDSINTWLSIEERLNYQRSVDAVIAAVGTEDAPITFFIDNVEFNTTAKEAGVLLNQIQLYADECYLTTKRHIVAVNALETIEEVDDFKYEEGYPEILRLTIGVE